MYYVIYNHEVAIWVFHEEFVERVVKGGYFLYGIATSKELADIKVEEACYF